MQATATKYRGQMDDFLAFLRDIIAFHPPLFSLYAQKTYGQSAL
jgi:hypothetical protein